MGRHSNVGYSKSKKAYITWFKGKRYRLKSCDACDRPNGPNYMAALEEFQRILREDSRTPIVGGTVEDCVKRWLDHCQTQTPRSVRSYESVLQPIRDKYGPLPAEKLTCEDVIRCIRAAKGWGACTRFHSLCRIKTLMAWNHRGHCINTNPLHGIRTPSDFHINPRGAEYVIPEELNNMLLAAATGRFRDFLTVMASTGARPIELYMAEHYHYKPDDRIILYEATATKGYIHKTAHRKKHGDRNRTIYLSDQAVEIVRANVKRRSWLLPNNRGNRYTVGLVLNAVQRLLRLKHVKEWMEEHNHNPKHVLPYSWRHTWITKALLKGVPIKTVADLCGNSVPMIEKHYAHASADRNAMRRAYLAAL